MEGPGVCNPRLLDHRLHALRLLDLGGYRRWLHRLHGHPDHPGQGSSDPPADVADLDPLRGLLPLGTDSGRFGSLIRYSPFVGAGMCRPPHVYLGVSSKAVSSDVGAFVSRTFQSFEYRSFRHWFVANVLAASAQWMQRVAQDWLVLTVLTQNSSFQVGVVTALQFLPILLLSPYAGVVVDRLDRKGIIQVTQTSFGIFGLLLGIMVFTGHAHLWLVYGLAFGGGVAAAFDSPARQAFVSELVPASSITNAVALNSVAFNFARLVGPAISGLMIDWAGEAWVFFVNSGMFLIAAMFTTSIRHKDLVPRRPVPRKKGQLREGLVYLRGRPDLILIIVVVGFASALALNQQLTTAVMATTVFHRGAGQYGMLSALIAVGSFSGALFAARRKLPRLRLVVGSTIALGVVSTILAFTPTYETYGIMCVPTGFAMITMLTSANAAVQTTTAEDVRGRVLALYGMVVMGSTPIGAPFVGWIGQVIDARASIWVGSVSTLIVTIIAAAVCMKRWDIHLHVRAGAHPIEIENPHAHHDPYMGN